MARICSETSLQLFVETWPPWIPSPRFRKLPESLSLPKIVKTACDRVRHIQRHGPSTGSQSLPSERIRLKPGSKRREIRNVRLGSLHAGSERLVGAIPYEIRRLFLLDQSSFDSQPRKNSRSRIPLAQKLQHP